MEVLSKVRNRNTQYNEPLPSFLSNELHHPDRLTQPSTPQYTLVDSIIDTHTHRSYQLD